VTGRSEPIVQSRREAKRLKKKDVLWRSSLKKKEAGRGRASQEVKGKKGKKAR